MMNGVVKFFNTSKNYGFVTGENGTDYFYHISGVDGGKVLNEGDKVTFETEKGDRGEKAVKIKKVEE
ncbi:MAG: cold-shock protein [Nanoarchaeota archaeon]|nr:cold-shock protein [Nanoarchaeota archaeon]